MSVREISGSLSFNTSRGRFSIARPHSLAKFIIYPSMWRLPDFNNLGALARRIKTNLLYFQTNYLILNLALFALAMILCMKTLLTGVMSAVIIGVAILFFFEHIPQARQIKQNHPTVVIVGSVILIIITWHALHTILIVVAALMAPIPLWFLHAAMRSSDNLIDAPQMLGNYFSNTPVGQIMQMLGIEPKASVLER